ncbi:hypothetical protein DID78_05925 [Candidatus Marinamargulisbacteria bacterium SCGC AG-343-D04]|nr:hypothetical protein DID78_05925 [Candidatus Marinamargulisbacteria bacterium SCGC AG-343-D04]
MTNKNKPSIKLKNIDKVIIVLSHLYKVNTSLFLYIFKELKLDIFTKEKLLTRIKEMPIYSQEHTRESLSECFNLLQSGELVPISTLHKLEDQINNSYEETHSDSNKLSFFSEFPVEDYASFLSEHPHPIKGLLCHSLSGKELKELFSTLAIDEISLYLKHYQNMSPSNEKCQNAFKLFLLNKLKLKKKQGLKSSHSKTQKLVEILEIFDEETFTKIDQLQVSNDMTEKLRPFFLDIEDILSFNTQDQKTIVNTLNEKKILPQVILNFNEETRLTLLSNLSERQRAIILEDIEYISKKSDKKSDISKFECIHTIRQLQKEQKIDSNIKQATQLEGEK